MSKIPDSIPKHPELKPAEDYYRLRREGIGHIEKMAGGLWTDYNAHDPGITILEALCYAITDLAYRTGWDIKDLLTAKTSGTEPGKPYPNQAFFTAKDILTVNPVAPDDFRRLLVDLDGVRNAWVFCKECSCDLFYYAWCEQDQLELAYQKPVNQDLQVKKVGPQGLYDVLLELESDPELGDLNDQKIIKSNFVTDGAGRIQPYTLELRFPEWGLLEQDNFNAFVNSADAPLVITTVEVPSDVLQANKSNASYINVKFSVNGQQIEINKVSLRIFGDKAAINLLATGQIEKDLSSVIHQYRRKLQTSRKHVKDAKDTLHKFRNLDEDFCRISVVNVQDVAVCADVEVKPDADIEWVQAKIWFEIGQYFNPPVLFYSLQEMQAENIPVEDIFNGPALKNGFIKAKELQQAELKSVLRTSDIINLLMDIEGVSAVNNLMLSSYDSEGNILATAPWVLSISDLHQPRLYPNMSRVLFFKNGLPFKPRMDEVNDTLVQLHGEAERPKFTNTPDDLTVPPGTFRHPEDYYPVQYSFPLVYGIGPEGLPSHATVQRKAQAKQLQAYLMVFEQLLGNALEQLAHCADLFSLDPSVGRTYFVKEFSKDIIKDYEDLIYGSDKNKLESLTETASEFLERRNRFLDHLLARFGEQFSGYVLLSGNYQGKRVALNRLINDKIAFLKAYPQISHDRGKAFNYKAAPCAEENCSGLKKRFSLLMGFPNLKFLWPETKAATMGQYEVKFQLSGQIDDQDNSHWLEGNITVSAADEAGAQQQAYNYIIKRMIRAEAYSTDQFQLRLHREDPMQILAQHIGLFSSETEAIMFRDKLLSWSANERAIVVEHLLLRPKFPGDALYPACADGGCITCGDEDPYSFRLSIIMPGWTSPFNTNMELRRFAERTLQKETPAHLLGKICWVANGGYVENPCDPVITKLAGLLMAKGLTPSAETDACDCAKAIYTAFSNKFTTWYQDKTLDFIHPDALDNMLCDEFGANIKAADFTCAIILNAQLWLDIQLLMARHFKHIALYGWQFERFEDAWCKWLEANAKIDWTQEHLHETVEAMLKANLVTGDKTGLCHCAAAILGQFGTDFFGWMEGNLMAGHVLTGFNVFNPTKISLREAQNASPTGLCGSFTFRPGTASLIENLLKDRYLLSYKEVSYQLWLVVNLLSQLRNTYPGATLHDCDDGNDQNPVRLGQTALGNNPPPTKTT